MSTLFIANSWNTKKFHSIKKTLEKTSLTDFSFIALRIPSAIFDPLTEAQTVATAEENMKLLFEDTTHDHINIKGIVIQKGLSLYDSDTRHPILLYCVLLYSKDGSQKIMRMYKACTLNKSIRVFVDGGMELKDAISYTYGKKSENKDFNLYEHVTRNEESEYLENILIDTLSFLT